MAWEAASTQPTDLFHYFKGLGPHAKCQQPRTLSFVSWSLEEIYKRAPHRLCQTCLAAFGKGTRAHAILTQLQQVEYHESCPKCHQPTLEIGEGYCTCRNPSCDYQNWEGNDETITMINSSSHGTVMVNAIGEWI